VAAVLEILELLRRSVCGSKHNLVLLRGNGVRELRRRSPPKLNCDTLRGEQLGKCRSPLAFVHTVKVEGVERVPRCKRLQNIENAVKGKLEIQILQFFIFGRFFSSVVLTFGKPEELKEPTYTSIISGAAHAHIC